MSFSSPHSLYKSDGLPFKQHVQFRRPRQKGALHRPLGQRCFCANSSSLVFRRCSQAVVARRSWSVLFARPTRWALSANTWGAYFAVRKYDSEQLGPFGRRLLKVVAARMIPFKSLQMVNRYFQCNCGAAGRGDSAPHLNWPRSRGTLPRRSFLSHIPAAVHVIIQKREGPWLHSLRPRPLITTYEAMSNLRPDRFDPDRRSLRPRRLFALSSRSTSHRHL